MKNMFKKLLMVFLFIVAPLYGAQFTLTWTDNSTNETGFRIERAPGLNATTNFSEIATVGTDVITYVDVDLPNNTSYSYRLRAYNAAGNSGYSNTASGTTPEIILNDFFFALALNEVSGSILFDSSTNHLDSSLIGSAARNSNGKYGSAINFIDNNSRIDIPNIDLTGESLTIAMWIKIGSNNSDARLISKAMGNLEQDHYWMISTTDDGGIKPRFRLKTSNGGTTTLIGTVNINIDQWEHIAAVYDGINMQLYVNGNVAGSIAKSGSLVSSISTPTSIGNQPQGGSPFNGLIDEVLIYEKALTSSQLLVLIETPLISNSNTNPTISNIDDVTINKNTPTSVIAFTIADIETSTTSLTVTATSSNTTLVPVANIVLGGSGGSRTVIVTPVSNQIGTATITISVSDGSLSTSEAFILTVNETIPAAPSGITLVSSE